MEREEFAKQSFRYIKNSINNNYKISSIHCNSLSRSKTKAKALGPVTSVDVEMLSNCIDFPKGRIGRVVMVVWVDEDKIF